MSSWCHTAGAQCGSPQCQQHSSDSAQTLAALPDQDTFYDVTDCLEQQGMEQVVQQYLGSKGTDLDLKQQFTLYEVSRAPAGSGHVPPASSREGECMGWQGCCCAWCHAPGLSTECSQAGG